MIFSIGVIIFILTWFVARVIANYDPLGYAEEKYWYLGLGVITSVIMIIYSLAKLLWNLMP